MIDSSNPKPFNPASPDSQKRALQNLLQAVGLQDAATPQQPEPKTWNQQKLQSQAEAEMLGLLSSDEPTE